MIIGLEISSGIVTPLQFKQNILPLKNKLFRFALTFLPNEAEAKDVVQEVMIKTWESIQELKSIASIEAWCMTLTRNRSLDVLKKKGRNYVQIVDQYNLHSPDADPLKKMEQKDSVGNIRVIISQLPPKQREVITLRDVKGYSYKEIAEMMRIEMGNVKILLHRARSTVKQQIIKVNNHGISHSPTTGR